MICRGREHEGQHRKVLYLPICLFLGSPVLNIDTASVVQEAAVLFAAVIMVGVGALPPAEVGIGPGSRMIPALLNARTSENPPSRTLVNKDGGRPGLS